MINLSAIRGIHSAGHQEIFRLPDDQTGGAVSAQSTKGCRMTDIPHAGWQIL
jgi:hypothetical protein